MFWIALLPPHEDDRASWGWRALQFTPRVACVDEALVLEVSTTETLWGGRQALLKKLLSACAPAHEPVWGVGGSSSVALAAARCKRDGIDVNLRDPASFPLDTLTAARQHLQTLERIGCRRWADLLQLPRAGVSRRFGAPLLLAIDQARGVKPESHAWLQWPESFDVKLELPTLALSSAELLWGGQRLLTQLHAWLQARNLGALSLELEWFLDLRKLDGKPLPPSETLLLSTAQPTQEMNHLRRLLAEQLARTTIAAPANALRLRTLQTVPWAGESTSLLIEEKKDGERLHQLVERLSARLGADNITCLEPREDWRPERMQASVQAVKTRRKPRAAHADALYPTWLLPTPIRLPVQGEVPCYGGPLRRLVRMYRVETGWWETGTPALRDYFIARSDAAGLVWIYRERPMQMADALEHAIGQQFRWYLQGLYA